MTQPPINNITTAEPGGTQPPITGLPSPPNPDYVPDLDEAARILTERGLPCSLLRGENRPGLQPVLVVTAEAVPLLLRLSEALLKAYVNGTYKQVELRHPVLRISQVTVVLTVQQAWDWMKKEAATHWYEDGCWFVLDQGPVNDKEPYGPRLRSKYTVESGQVISQGWE